VCTVRECVYIHPPPHVPYTHSRNIINVSKLSKTSRSLKVELGTQRSMSPYPLSMLFALRCLVAGVFVAPPTFLLQKRAAHEPIPTVLR
jgi:hypothetical protein